MTKDKLTIFGDRLKRIGINIECAGNIPWIYLNKVNGKRVKETGNGGNHGYVIGWYGKEIRLADDMSGVFELIRKYR
jgi:hypothetical protein